MVLDYLPCDANPEKKSDMQTYHIQAQLNLKALNNQHAISC